MDKGRGRLMIAGVAALALLAMSFSPPRADIRILAHDAADRAPARVQAAVDLGVVAVSFLLTWSRRVAR